MWLTIKQSKIEVTAPPMKLSAVTIMLSIGRKMTNYVFPKDSSSSGKKIVEFWPNGVYPSSRRGPWCRPTYWPVPEWCCELFFVVMQPNASSLSTMLKSEINKQCLGPNERQKSAVLCWHMECGWDQTHLNAHTHTLCLRWSYLHTHFHVLVQIQTIRPMSVDIPPYANLQKLGEKE